MFIKIDQLKGCYPCKITSLGHTEAGVDEGLKVVSQVDFIEEYLIDIIDQIELKDKTEKNLSQAEKIIALAKEWEEATGISNRTFFSGKVYELALIAAEKCLEKPWVEASTLDAIVFGSNTSTGYPSGADYLKDLLSKAGKLVRDKSNALAFDVQEACTVGTVAPYLGWNLIRSGACENVLVVLAEKATELADIKDWKGSNLFGDGAGAFLLQRARFGEVENFLFFEIDSLPYDGKLGAIYKNQSGYFSQDGRKVHKFVGRDVMSYVNESIIQAGITPEDIDHFVPHQPSGRTLDLLEEGVKKLWPNFKGKFHRDKDTGNTSGASTPMLLSKLISKKEIKPGELVLVSTFGAGLSYGNYAFIL